jgi:peptide/nickel transport system permease protein
MNRAARFALALLCLLYAAALCAGLLAPYAPDRQFRGEAWTPPNSRFLLGTDGLGRDQFSRLLHGARTSLVAGTAAAAFAVLLGGLLGAVAALSEGWLDALLMRAADLFLAIPWTYALLAVRAVLPLDLSPAWTFAAMMLVLGLVGWARPARLTRGIVLSARSSEYVHAARAFGASRAYILLRHLLPEARSALTVHFVLAAPQFLTAEATLSFLGLGFPESHPSWGNLLAALTRLHVLVEYWWMFAPALIFVALMACYHTVGRGFEVQAGPDPR